MNEFRSDHKMEFSSVQLLSGIRLFVTPWTAACQASLSITNSQSLLKLMSIKLVMTSHHLILCCPHLLASIFPSIRVFSNELVLHIRWPKYWRLFQHQSFQWIFRTDFFWDELVWSPCYPWDSQESSLTPQLKSLKSKVEEATLFTILEDAALRQEAGVPLTRVESHL